MQMKILILNGSPRLNGNTIHMVNGFKAGAEDAGHSVQIENVAHMNIRGCMACEYCHTKERGRLRAEGRYAKALSGDSVCRYAGFCVAHLLLQPVRPTSECNTPHLCD